MRDQLPKLGLRLSKTKTFNKFSEHGAFLNKQFIQISGPVTFLLIEIYLESKISRQSSTSIFYNDIV